MKQTLGGVGTGLRAGALAAMAVSAIACAPLQRIPLRVVPASSTLFVDGEEWGPTPSEVELRADTDHKLYFKSAGHRPALVILRSLPEPELRLEPTEVEVVLEPLSAQGRRLRIQTDE